MDFLSKRVKMSKTWNVLGAMEEEAHLSTRFRRPAQPCEGGRTRELGGFIRVHRFVLTVTQ